MVDSEFQWDKFCAIDNNGTDSVNINWQQANYIIYQLRLRPIVFDRLGCHMKNQINLDLHETLQGDGEYFDMVGTKI